MLLLVSELVNLYFFSIESANLYNLPFFPKPPNTTGVNKDVQKSENTRSGNEHEAFDLSLH